MISPLPPEVTRFFWLAHNRPSSKLHERATWIQERNVTYPLRPSTEALLPDRS